MGSFRGWHARALGASCSRACRAFPSEGPIWERRLAGGRHFGHLILNVPEPVTSCITSPSRLGTAPLGHRQFATKPDPQKSEVLIVPFPTNEQAGTMSAALHLACNELCIGADDLANRGRVASAIMTLSQAGQEDVGQLKTYAVYRYRTLAC